MMANDMHDERRDPTQAVEETEAAAQVDGSGPAEATQADALAPVLAERDELKDRVLRTLAEMENLRRRTEREVADARA